MKKTTILILIILLVFAPKAWAQWNGSGTETDPYQISSTADWNTLADKVNNGNQTYSSKFFKLMADITVTETVTSGTPTTMVGTSDSKSFRGTFDGNGHTITLYYYDTRDADFCAPFRYINGATIRYLHVDGTIYKSKGKNAGGLVGKAVGNNTIDNCRSSVDILFNKDGDVSSGGFIGELRESGGTTFNNCLFDGKLRGPNAYKWGGFVGWVASKRTVTFNNCLFNPAQINFDINDGSDNSKTFARHDGTVNVNNCYYKTLIKDAQGATNARNMNNEQLLSVLGGGWETVSESNVEKVVPIRVVHPLTGDGTESSPFLIASAEDWNNFAANVFLGQSYSGKFFKLTNNISVTRSVGVYGKSFNGTFDGDGHTLTVTLNSDARWCAPFAFTYGATIKNLITAGTIETSNTNAGGVVGRNGTGKLIMTNVTSSVTINSTYNGDAQHGGLVGYTLQAEFTGCAFTGSLTGANSTNCGGLLGYKTYESDQTRKATFTNCVFAPTIVTVSATNFYTFANNSTNGVVEITNCYYTQTLGIAQGTIVHSIAPGNYVTVAYNGNATAEYDVSGITCYASGIMLNNVLYASNGTAVSLNLGHTLPEGCEFSGYQINAGTLEGSQNPYTLTMPNEDVIVNVIANFNPWDGEGTPASPYLISNANHWELLAVGVNSGFTYSGKYFRLTDDISVTSMVGSADHKFCGHFDGYSKTLSVNYNTNEPCTAPFRYIEGAEISNLHITGTISTSAKFAGGFVAHAQGYNTMTNCRSSVTINSTVSGDGSHGGFIAINTGGTFTMEGCTFDGSMLGSSTNNCGGFVGWNETNGSPSGTVIFTNCFLVPTSITVGIERTYARSRTNDGAHVQMYYSNCRTNFGDNQQFRAYSISAGNNVTMNANVSVQNTYTVSGLTMFITGMMYDGVLYARNDQSMSLNLSYTGTGSATGFGTTAGSLSGDSSPFTLTMGTADAVINAIINGSGSGWSGSGSGTSESPYIISNSDKWDEFADKVNNGVFGFNTAYYKLAADISVTTMVGTDGHKFKGHFDGGGHTLTLSYGSVGSPFSENYCAPFRYIEDADIHNLIVDGNIYTNHQFAAGIAGYALNDNAITDCRSSVTINSSVSGDGTHGGFVANCQNYTDGATYVTFTRCAFNGHLLGSATSECGGFVGWAAGNDWAGVKFVDCIFAPSEVSILTDGSATFSRGRSNNDFITVSVENSYYTQRFGIRQGEMAYVTQPADVTTEAMTIAGVTVYVKKTLVTNVAATEITPTTANISWTGSNTCSNYQVRYRVKPNADIYSTSFEDGLPDGWTMFDNDDDENNWTYDDGSKKGMAHSGKGCMYSASYINNYGALEPDNWLVSPQLQLGGTMKVWLKGQDEDEYGEHFAIYLSTSTTGIKSDFLDNEGNLQSGVITLVPETETTNEYQEYTADLSAYSGQGYIAIRHFNCYDEFYLVVDDFCLYDDNAGDEWTVVSDASPGGTTLEGLTYSTTYEYQVGFDYNGNTFYTTTATLTTLAEDIAPIGLRATSITANTATIKWTGYGDSYNLTYSRGGVAKVTLYVPNDIWEDGSGYQMLLDEDHNTYGTVIPETGGLTTSGDAPEGLYDNFEYKIPENADGAMNTSNVVDGSNDNKSVTITIPAGIYDWCITNPSPDDRVWIASQNGNVGGRQNDFTFEAGMHYTFTVTLDGDSGNDCVNMTVEEDATLVPGDVTNVTGITSTSYTLSDLTASTEYTVYVQSVKGDKTSEWSKIYFTTLGEGEMALYVAGYGDSNSGYVLLASPAGTVNPENVANMLANAYDLYAFDQAEDQEWRNYEVDAFDLEPGKGYLYANSEDIVLLFPGEAYTGSGEVTLSKITGAEWEGWNLVGNPFNENAYIADGRSFYTMNGDGSEIIAATNNSIEAMEGVFVIANNDGETMTFTTTEPANNGKAMLALNLSRANRCGASTSSATAVIDRAIVRFDEGSLLPKHQVFGNNTKVYIPQDGQDYAVVRAKTQGELPLNFKAKENGTYTLSINSENTAFDYLHLIDNMTGLDIDLLVTPSYTFEAKTTDYESRFKIVFATKDGPSTDSETFAFVSNGNIIVNGEGTLQVIDIMGHIIVSGDAINRVSTSGMPAGVYVLRLINGNDIKTQKIVVK